MDKKINYGFIPSKIEPDHYILGGSELFKLVYMPDGNWAGYLPKYEPQYENFETAGCTVWGTQNAIEILIKRLYEFEPNYSERFTYILAGIRPPGGDPHKVAEVIRKNGLVNDDLLPNKTETFEDFIKPNPLTKELIDKGEEWLNQYDFGHEWLWTNNPPKQIRLNLLKEYLRYSPVCVSVTAWASDSEGLYYAYNNAPNNHWCVCYGLDGESPLIFDSYDQSKKKLHPDHPIQMAKRYYIGKSTRQEKLGMIESVLKWIAEQIKLLITTPEAPKTPVVESKPPIVEVPKYKWGNAVETKHSIRVICDERGLSLSEKNLICAVIQAESGFNTQAVNQNADQHKSVDWGICQINDHYWIGAGKQFASVKQVLDQPELSVRFMINCYKQGNLNWWIAYKNGSYKKFLV